MSNEDSMEKSSDVNDMCSRWTGRVRGNVGRRDTCPADEGRIVEVLESHKDS
jgi:hypothetical protein